MSEKIVIYAGMGIFFVVMWVLISKLAKRAENKLCEFYHQKYTDLAERVGGDANFDAMFHDDYFVGATLHGVDVKLDLHRTGTSQTYVDWNRAIAHFDSIPSSLSFEVLPNQSLSKLGKALGGQDIEIGVISFDDAFVIKSNDEQFIHRLLSPELIQYHLSVPDLRVELSNGYVTVLRRAEGAELDDLEAVMVLAGMYGAASLLATAVT